MEPKMGDKTVFGTVVSMMTQPRGERYYFMEDKHGVISMIPADFFIQQRPKNNGVHNGH